MSRILGLILAAAAAVLGSGCAGDSPPDANQPADPNHVSSIPWDRPAQWEGQGPMSGMMPGNSR